MSAVIRRLSSVDSSLLPPHSYPFEIPVRKTVTLRCNVVLPLEPNRTRTRETDTERRVTSWADKGHGWSTAAKGSRLEAHGYSSE